MKKRTRVIQFNMDEPSRTATIDFGASVPGTAGQLYAQYNNVKRPHYAELTHLTETKPGTYVIQTKSEGAFVDAVGYFILAGVLLHGWIRANTEVIETRDEGERSWSLGGDGLASWTLIQQT